MRGALSTTRPAELLRSLALLLVLGAFAPFALSGCVLRRARPPVILISIDTCRSDRLSCYGYPRPSTPNLDAFAREAVLFSQAQSPIPMTLPAHCSMMTGLLPPEHGVRDNLSYRLADSRTTLAEILQSKGYATGAVIGAFVLDSRFHLDQGFQEYDDRMETLHTSITSLNERKAAEVTRLGLTWLERRDPASPFFLFLHYYDAHLPYSPPEPFATTFRDDPYAGEIANVDAGIGRIFDELKRRDLYDKSLIIVAGDHGESLGEHGEKAHEYFIYQSTLHVPLLIKAPGARVGRRDDRPASLVDLLPTVLHACGFRPPARLSGENLLAPVSAREEQRPLYAESLTPTRYGCSPLKGVRIGDWMYIETTRPELYNLAQDQAETTNLAAIDSQRAAAMATSLRSLLAAHSESPADSRMVPDEETRQRLQSLGYLAGHTVEEKADSSHPDPKDYIEDHEALQDALGLLSRHEYDQAIALCKQILEKRPGMLDVHMLLGDIEAESGRSAEAIADYRKYLEVSAAANKPGDAAERLSPNTARAHYNLGNTLADLGRTEEALSEYREALRADPGHIDARFNMGLSLAGAGRLDEAISEFSEVLKIKPDWPEDHYNLARALLLRGRTDEALSHFQEAVRLRPSYAEAEKGLGDALAVEGRIAEAVTHFENAVRLRPDLSDPWLSLAHGYLRLHETDLALSAYRSALKAFPDWPVALNELAWILATHQDDRVRDGAEAVRLAEAANSKTSYKDPQFLETLAAAYAEAGRFPDAVRTEEKAMEQVQAAGRTGTGVTTGPAGGPADPAAVEARVAAMRDRTEQYRREHRMRSRF